MSQPVHNLGIVDAKRAAIVLLCLTGFLMLINLRHGITHPDGNSYWLFDTRMFLPTRAALTLNLLFYAYLLGIGIVLYRAAQGKERLIVKWLVRTYLSWPHPIFFLDFS
jgi:hypothetical protein